MRDASFEPQDDTPTTETDVTLHAIRSVLSDSTDTTAHPAPSAVAPAQPHMNAETNSEPSAVPPKEYISGGLKDRVVDAITSYRPTRRHIAWGVFALLVILRPNWVLLGFFMLLFITAGAFICLGADRVWSAMMRMLHAYGKRRPAQAAHLSAKLDAFALRWDALLDRFPDGSVDGLYLPDFQAIQARDDAHAEVMDARLARLQTES